MITKRNPIRRSRFCLVMAGAVVTSLGAQALAQPSLLVVQELNAIDVDEIVPLGQTVLGETSDHLFRLLNTGDETLNVDDIEIVGGFGFLFSAEVLNDSVNAGLETILVVSFEAGGIFQGEATGGRGAGIILHTNDPAHPSGFQFLVTAVVTEAPVPVMQVMSDDTVIPNNGLINLGLVEVDETFEFDLEVESIGSGPLTISGVTANGDVELVSGFNQTIERQDVATYTFSVTAPAPGTRQSTIAFENDSAQNPYQITVVVDATDEDLVPAPDPPLPTEPDPLPDPNHDPNPGPGPGPDLQPDFDEPDPDFGDTQQPVPQLPMFCGAGSLGMMSFMLAGLCSLKAGSSLRRRRR